MKFLWALALCCLAALPLRAEPVTILALGDSLTAGYGLDVPDSYAAQLEKALRGLGHDVTVINGGVSGDTAAQGAARLDWSLTEEIDAVVIELGANDMLRGLPPQQAEAALDDILTKLAARKLPALLMGMRASPNMGPDYVAAFDGIYPRLSQKHGVELYPFFLEGVAADQSLNQADGLHPTRDGVARIVTLTLPAVNRLIERALKRQQE